MPTYKYNFGDTGGFVKFAGLGASVNSTYVTSNVNVPGRLSEDIPFFSQSDKILNAALFYERGPFEARVAVSYRSAFIVNVQVVGLLSNIFKAPNTFYQTTSHQTYSREIYSFNGDFGISVQF